MLLHYKILYTIEEAIFSEIDFYSFNFLSIASTPCRINHCHQVIAEKVDLDIWAPDAGRTKGVLHHGQSQPCPVGWDGHFSKFHS